jgi:rubrerythrin
MKTSLSWWNEVRQSPELLADWLVKQYRGEVTAATRIRELADKFEISTRFKSILEAIAQQEETHATWIKELLVARGLTPSINNAENRYWQETLPGITDFETGSAIAAHAEKMRLDRIKVISEDSQAPHDIVSAFTKILKDELWHERMFREMSSEQAMESTAGDHERGMRVLGLVA